MTTTNSHRTDTVSNSQSMPSQTTPERRVIRPSELGQVEACLESVVVPGELEAWTTALLQACQAEVPVLRREITVSHAKQFTKLNAADTNLAQRVVQMQREDAEILAALADFEGKVQRLHERAPLAGPREDKFEEGLKAVTDEGLALVIRVRKQERALNTWFAEAFQRDTGVGD